MSLRVLVVEDHSDLARSFAYAISALPSLSLVATVHTVAEARRMLLSHAVDLCLVDLGLPDGSGMDLIKLAAAQDPEIKSLVVTMFGDETTVIECLEAGASGFILKEELTSPITHEISKLLNGGSALSPQIARMLIKRFQTRQLLPEQAGEAQDAAPLTETEKVRLSKREQGVLQLIARGYTYAEVGAYLHIAEDTVNVHLRNTYRKLSVHSKTEAVYEANRMGLLKD
ncbi:MAG: hypothetical protein RLZZ502_1441 [Pseudomonadota bacterium]|jgi:DNA-binding NarL/FixJ family response regulator